MSAQEGGSDGFDWTVKGVHDPQECDIENVATFDVVLYDETGTQVGELSAHCDVAITARIRRSAHRDARA